MRCPLPRVQLLQFKAILQDKKPSKDAKKQQKKLLKEAKALVAAQGMDIPGLSASTSILKHN